MGRRAGPLGGEHNQPFVDDGTLARTETPVPGALGSLTSSPGALLDAVELLTQTEDKKLWYYKIEFYSQWPKGMPGSDRLNPPAWGKSYGDVSYQIVRQVPIEEYEKFLYEYACKYSQQVAQAVKAMVNAQAEYYRKLDSPYPIPDYLKYPDKFAPPNPSSAPTDPITVFMDGAGRLLEQKETKMVIDIASFVCVWLRGARLARGLAAFDLITNALTGDFDGLPGVLKGAAIGKLYKYEAVRTLLGLESESIVEITEWGTGKVVDYVGGVLSADAGGPGAGNTALKKYLKVRAFRYACDEAFRKESDELMQKLWQNLLEAQKQNLLEMQKQMYKPPGAPKGK